MSVRRFFTTYTLYFGVVLLVLGLILFILGILGMLYSDAAPDENPLSGPLLDIVEWIGGWWFWSLLIGFILTLAGGWYFIDNIRKRREFKELLEITSKKKFIQNLDRLEYLAWKLTPWHRIEVSKKKKKFHIK